jgi:hypothetical protein
MPTLAQIRLSPKLQEELSRTLSIIKIKHRIWQDPFFKGEEVLVAVEASRILAFLRQISFVLVAVIYPQIPIMKMKLAQPLTPMSSIL